MMRSTDRQDRKLSKEYFELLDAAHDEQTYQRFIEKNTKLVPREFVLNHGVHFALVLRKVPFGADYRSDFVFLTKSTVRWHCVLIEIEKPQSAYFKPGKNDFHADFQSACDQITSWKAWFDVPSNKDHFVNGIMGQLKVPLSQNPVDIKYVLVHGRRREIETSEIRKARVRAKENIDFRIISFDSLAEFLPSKYELWLGVRKNEYIEILSKKYVNDTIFAWMRPEMLRISSELRAKLAAEPTGMAMVFEDGEPISAISRYLTATS